MLASTARYYLIRSQLKLLSVRKSPPQSIRGTYA